MNTNELNKVFSLPLLSWFDKHGRKNLPWQHPKTPYRVWISEVMLQQTQVQTVIPYFERFITSFPNVHVLSMASEDAVLSHWSGLGYYSRARNIHKSAKIICEKYQGSFPSEVVELRSLPGIGDSTAAAIASIAFQKPTPILDGNVIRVLSRYFMVDGWHGQSAIKRRLWELASLCMSLERPADYTQAIMDLGAICCTRSQPNCVQCPLQKTCLAKLNNSIGGYPFKRIKKTRPTKQQQLLLLYTENQQIYLEKRPPAGIWGGLWCLPMMDITEDAIEFIHKKYGLLCSATNKLMDISHSFSHFQLEIQAMSLSVSPSNSQIAEASGKWFHVDELNSVGLAKPVSQTINHFLSI